MADYPNPEDACFYFDDPEELYWPKLTPEEKENVRKAIEPHYLSIQRKLSAFLLDTFNCNAELRRL
ncbi:hypothetical protein [Ligilactobacillus animalis]|uniref:hypothetical protein n=1 Tax=Ligilactobacillus animalis TaxID=1605 RepID=UPI002FDA41E4